MTYDATVDALAAFTEALRTESVVSEHDDNRECYDETPDATG